MIRLLAFLMLFVTCSTPAFCHRIDLNHVAQVTIVGQKSHNPLGLLRKKYSISAHFEIQMDDTKCVRRGVHAFAKDVAKSDASLDVVVGLWKNMRVEDRVNGVTVENLGDAINKSLPVIIERQLQS